MPASYPYTMLLEWGTVNAEIVTVTARTGTALTVTRGSDGTTGVSHVQGSLIIHGVSQRDFDEPQVHMDSAAAHGATGAIVGTTNTQTLTGKTLTTPTITAAGWTNANHTHADSATGGLVSVPADLMGTIPAQHGMLQWSYNPIVSTVHQLVPALATTIYLQRVFLNAGTTVTGVGFYIGSQGAGSGLTNSYTCMFSVSGTTATREGVSANWGTSIAASTYHEKDFTTPYVVAASGYYYLGYQVGGHSGGVNQPYFTIRETAGIAALVNMNQTTGTYNSTHYTNGNTTIPTSLTLSNNSNGVTHFMSAYT